MDFHVDGPIYLMIMLVIYMNSPIYLMVDSCGCVDDQGKLLPLSAFQTALSSCRWNSGLEARGAVFPAPKMGTSRKMYHVYRENEHDDNPMDFEVVVQSFPQKTWIVAGHLFGWIPTCQGFLHG